MAGALGRRLGGAVTYDGEPAQRAILGDGPRPDARDLARALRRPLGVAGMLRHVAERHGRTMLWGGMVPGLVQRLADWTRIDARHGSSA